MFENEQELSGGKILKMELKINKDGVKISVGSLFTFFVVFLFFFE